MLLANFVSATVFSSKLSPVITSSGRKISQLLSLVFSINFFEISNKFDSYKDFPISYPEAFRKVLTIPPPRISVSTFSRSVSSIVSFVDTFAPPIITTIGFSGFLNALVRAFNSLINRGPAADTEAYFATP